MSTTTAPALRPSTHGRTPVDVDTVVIGAGFAGLRALYDLQQRGISARCLESAPEVGGVWYWNSYPGARTDSQSWIYAFSFSEELQNEWDWSERYTSQRESLEYLKYVADRFDLRKDITFNTKVTSAIYDADREVWTVTTSEGEELTTRFVITAVGPLSDPHQPDFPGLDSFGGEWYMTARWPEAHVDLTGKRVAVIGTGATGVQMIPTIAHTADHVTVFQRTPNYVVPARNTTMSKHELEGIRSRYEEIWKQARSQVFGFDLAPAGRVSEDVTAEEAQLILERGWEIGGFHFMFETFDDMFTDDRTNDLASEFIRNKIRTIVKDPATAELLCPKDYPFCGKRPPLGHYYYETYNRDNVTLVDVSKEPISQITPHGLKAGDTEYEVDVIIFATGFDAATGAITQIDIRGRDGESIAAKWENGPVTNLGTLADGFPNLFMIFGPQTPFANAPVVIEDSSQWIADAIVHMRDEKLGTIEAEVDASKQWAELLLTILNATVVARGRNNYFLGDNIPGKAHAPYFFLGGVQAYRDALKASADAGYAGFALT